MAASATGAMAPSVRLNRGPARARLPSPPGRETWLLPVTKRLEVTEGVLGLAEAGARADGSTGSGPTFKPGTFMVPRVQLPGVGQAKRWGL